MANAMRETGEVARDRDLLASCSALAAEAQDREDEGSVYLQEMAFSRTGIRAVTTSRTLIACYRMVARSEGAAFCDATGSVISKIRVRPNKPDAKNVHVRALGAVLCRGAAEPTEAASRAHRAQQQHAERNGGE